MTTLLPYHITYLQATLLTADVTYWRRYLLMTLLPYHITYLQATLLTDDVTYWRRYLLPTLLTGTAIY